MRKITPPAEKGPVRNIAPVIVKKNNKPKERNYLRDLIKQNFNKYEKHLSLQFSSIFIIILTKIMTWFSLVTGMQIFVLIPQSSTYYSICTVLMRYEK
jgi:hypothetical protein